MHRKVWLSGFILILALCAMQRPTTAQDANSAAKSAPSAYHFDFSINELEGGKKLNSRKYSLDLTGDEGGRDLKIGTRIPIQSEDGKFEYLDIGTSINARLLTYHTPSVLVVNVEISSFATPDEAAKGGHPLLRQMRISASTPVIPGKAVVIGSVDDPNSTHQFQLEVTATKL